MTNKKVNSEIRLIDIETWLTSTTEIERLNYDQKCKLDVLLMISKINTNGT